MKKEIHFNIDGIEVVAQKGETILQVARKNGIYIPTMCYISKTSPCASCRMCIVEVEGQDDYVLSCNTNPVEGIKVITSTQELNHERTNIMKLYDVNHPLECGVCDKSGECDLQNKTLEFNVARQDFGAIDRYRPLKEWGLINYEPSLCILCEKCVHVCNEVIGDDAIEVQFGGYKSTIIPKGSEVLDCTFCGECIAVCPVGALTSSGFRYKANAWELSRVPATCAHCSAGCSLEYEVRHESINGDKKIFRVKNNFEFTNLCGAGRFGYDFENRMASDEKAFEDALKALRSAKAIRFSSMITNEEALILQKLKDKLGIKLFNEDAREFAEFMDSFSSISGKKHYSANLDDIRKSDAVVLVGSRIATDNPGVRYAMTVASKSKGAKILYAHPLEDTLMQNVVTQFMKYEVGSEEGVLALLAYNLLKDKNLESSYRAFLDDLDLGYLYAETNLGEEEFAKMLKSFSRAKAKTLIVGNDLISHKRAKNIAKLAALIEKYSDFKVLVVAKDVNTLGVSLINSLDKDEPIDEVVGYNAKGDFVISSDGNGDLSTPALNQQEGTFVSLDKKVLPTNVALAFDGYTLNDLANSLGIESEYTIDYTSKLPQSGGFREVEFDELENFMGSLGEDIRGYELDEVSCETKTDLEEVEDLDEYNGTIIYHVNPVLQFNSYTNKTEQLPKDEYLRGSAQFGVAAKISDGDLVDIEFSSHKIQRVFKLDSELKGTIALNPLYDLDIELSGYRFEKSRIKRVVNE
ncbi:MAG: NADH-quinone oxidoreductase subunit G [Sulfurimonas sp.]|nr:NADH-quinone oxidoreductase subunit G [Sulfurimonadaceae bacterium]